MRDRRWLPLGHRHALGRAHAALVARVDVADDVGLFAIRRWGATQRRARRAARAIAVRATHEARAATQREAGAVVRILEHGMTVRPRVARGLRRHGGARGAAAARATTSTT